MKFFRKFLPLIVFILLFGKTAHSQDDLKVVPACENCDGNDKVKTLGGEFKKGEFFFYWGYNRAYFSKSDIRFTGLGSDFTLEDVSAKDRPTPFNFKDYVLAPSVPQFVVSAGWFFKDNWCLTLGTDHMKYVMVADQTVTINGEIAKNDETGEYTGHYSGDRIRLTPEFLMYEHTNGLNYVNTGLEYYKVLWDAKKGPFKLTVVPGMSLALMYPRSDVSLFGVPGDNVFHVAGWGAALHGGLRFNLLRNVFVLWNNKGGFIALPDVLCSFNRYDARQHFFFYQSALSLGVNWRF